MTPTVIPKPGPRAAVSVSEVLERRCAELGLLAWTIPVDSGPVPIGLAAGTPWRDHRGLIDAAAATAAERDSVWSPFPGCWMAPLTLTRTLRAVVGGLSPEAAAALSLPGIESGGLLRHDERTLDVAWSMLRGTILDLTELFESRHALQGFTQELTESYETVHLLYSLGRAMTAPDRPDVFLRLSLERVREARSFAWVAASFLPDSALPQGISARSYAEGPADMEVIRRRLPALVASIDPESLTPRIIEWPELCRGQSRHVILQPLALNSNVVGLMVAGDKQGQDPHPSSYDSQLVEGAARTLCSFLSNASLYDAQQRMFLGVVRALSASIDAKDRYTRGHSDRVAHLARLLAVRTGDSDAIADRIHIAGLLHDVGKIGVPEAVLCKQGKLADEEFALIKQHPEIGARILEGIPLLADVIPGVLHHHERHDGRGYPFGLVGEHIPRVARILAVCDTFDAMSSTRSYRSAMPRQRVLDEIARSAGTQLDPDLARAFVHLDLRQYDDMVLSAELRTAA